MSVEVYRFNDETGDPAQKERVVEVAKVIVKAMDTCGPLTFDIGLNALIMAMSGALVTIDEPYEKKIKVAKAVSDAIILNMYPDGAPN